MPATVTKVVTLGAKLIVLVFKPPGVHVYVCALPLTVKLAASPIQMLELLATILKVGNGFVEIAMVAVALQLLVFPLNVNIVFAKTTGEYTDKVLALGIQV